MEIVVMIFLVFFFVLGVSDLRNTIFCTTAPAGSGKTYIRGACFLADEFLPYQKGVHWSNFPIKRQEMADFVVKKYGGRHQEYIERIQFIPKEELDRWKRGEAGPWSFFRSIPKDEFSYDDIPGDWAGFYDRRNICEDREILTPKELDEGKIPREMVGYDLDGAYIAIDEAHNFIGTFSGAANTSNKNSKAQLLRNWQGFMGELRHRGTKLEFITQDRSKLHPTVFNDASARIVLINSENDIEPFFKIRWGDWLELKAKITGKYNPAVHEIEKQKEDGKEVVKRHQKFYLTKEYFDLYDSFSAPEMGGKKAGGNKALREFQKRNLFQLIVWFVRRNATEVSSRFVILVVALWFVFGGGSYLLNTVMGALTHGTGGQETVQAAEGTFSEKHTSPRFVRRFGSGNAREGQNSRTVFTGQSKIVGGDSAEYQKRNEAIISKLRKEIVLLKSQVLSSESRLKLIQKDLADRSSLVLVTPSEIVFRDGAVYSIFESISHGKYKGKKVVKIDWRKRQVQLDDDSLLRMDFVRSSGSGISVSDGLRETVGKLNP